ncbi:MAG: aminomethyltransferase [Gammaproteobacteria bacterium]|jgi:aminomethyltransferase
MSVREADKRVLTTPFYSRTSALCETNLWSPWKAYTTVDCYSVLFEEYFAIRNATAVFDLTPMTKYRISGIDGLAYLDKLMTRKMSKLTPGRVMYGAWCNDLGHVLDDGTVFHLEENVWRLCSQERHMDWLQATAMGFEVEIEDETDDVVGLAVQGPTSCQTLKSMGLQGVENIKPFQMRSFPFANSELLVSRTGFTGDLGYELWVTPDLAEKLWDALFEAGKSHGILPIGSHALDIARIEAGFIQADVDFVPALNVVRAGRGRSPFELGLDWLVHFDKPIFNGRKALLKEKETGSRYRFVRLDVEGNKPANDSFVYNGKKEIVGHVTSATWSPSAKKNIALASVEMPWGRPEDELYAEIYYNRELQWNRLMARCHVVEGAFFDPPRRRETPPLDY